jgi:hypothetical protein
MTDDTLDCWAGAEELPSKEDGLNNSQSGRASTETLAAGAEGEKGEA